MSRKFVLHRVYTKLNGSVKFLKEAWAGQPRLAALRIFKNTMKIVPHLNFAIKETGTPKSELYYYVGTFDDGKVSVVRHKDSLFDTPWRSTAAESENEEELEEDSENDDSEQNEAKQDGTSKHDKTLMLVSFLDEELTKKAALLLKSEETAKKLQEEVISLQHTRIEHLRTIDSLSLSLQKLTSQNKQLSKELTKNETLLSESEEAIKGLQEEVTNFHHDKAAHLKTMEMMEGRIKKLTSQNNQLKKERDLLMEKDSRLIDCTAPSQMQEETPIVYDIKDLCEAPTGATVDPSKSPETPDEHTLRARSIMALFELEPAPKK